MKLLHIFWETSMSGRQPALEKIAKKVGGIKVSDLKPGDLLVFVNRAQNRIATLSMVPESESFGVMGYYRSPHDRKINLRAIKYIPESLGMNGEINMDKATHKALLEQLRIKDDE